MKTRRIRDAWRFVGWGWGLLMALLCPPALAQKNDPERQISNVFLPAPRELSQRLAHARKAIENEEFADAVTQLGRLLLELEDQPSTDTGDDQPQDYFIGPRGDAGTHTSLKTEAQRLIGSMPPKGREWYELQFGAQARALLEEAVAQNDPAKLTGVSRRFFHTKAGYEATVLMGRYYMDRGQPLAAALSLKRVAESPAAADFEPELSLLLSTCWLHANQPDKAQQTLVELHKRNPRLRWRVGNDAVEFPADDKQALPWFEKLVGLVRRGGLSDALQWVLFRGNTSRNATSQGDMPLSRARWRVPTNNDPNKEKIAQQVEKRWLSSGTPSVPSLHPLAVKDTILVRTPDVVLGVDFRSGKRLWVFPWDEMDAPPSSSGSPVVRMPGAVNGASQVELELRQQLWEDAPFGQLSSDGELVFLIHGLRFAAPGSPFMPIMVGPNGRVIGPRGNLTANKLVALDLKREGAYQWVIGDDQGGGGDEPKLAGAFFLGAPLPLQGQLYVLAEINAEVRLVVLNARTGKLEWQQQIAHLETRNILVDAQRRLAGASPSYADGVLVCPTSAGAVVAVDVATRTLLWGYQYGQPTNENRNGVMFRNAMGVAQRPYGNRWLDATVAIHEGRVIMTPVEADELYCVDLLTGKLAWPARKRDDGLYVAGVHDGNILVVGRRGVQALKLSNGEPAWPQPVEFPENGSPSGRGILSQDYYYVPVSTSQLVKIDLKNGKIDKSIPTEQVLGNLICYNDEIVSLSVDGLSAYHMVTPLRTRVSQLLDKNPEDGWALARLGELQLYDGQRVESLATLRRAFQRNEQDESLRTLLVSTLLTVLRDDFAANRQLAPEIERLINQPAQRAEYLRLMAEGMKRSGEFEAAFSAFLNLAGVQQSLVAGTNAAPPMEQVSHRHAVRRDRWIQSNLAEIYLAATADQRAKMDEAIGRARQESLNFGDLNAARNFLRYYGFHPSADSVRLELAGRLIDVDGLLEAEMLLASLETHADRKLAGSAVAETARLLIKARLLDQAADYLRRMSTDFSDIVCRNGQTGSQFVAAALASEPALRPSQEGATWPYGRVTIEEAENRALANANYGRNIPLPVRDAVGAVPAGLYVSYDLNRAQTLMIRDGHGRELQQVQVNRPDGRLQYFFSSTQYLSHVRARGHLLLLNLGLEVFAVNALRVPGRSDDSLRWRQEMMVASTDANRSLPRFQTSVNNTPWGFNRYSISMTGGEDAPVGSLGPLNAHAVYFQKQRELVAADPLTGDIVWSRADFDAGCDLLGDDDLLIVIPPKSTEAFVLNALDGRDVGKCKVEPVEQRWLSNGRRLLTWSQSGNNLGLKLTDLPSGKILYDGKHPTGSRGTVVGTDELAVLQPDGNLFVLSLVDGGFRLQAKVEPEPALQSVTVQRTGDQYLVIAAIPAANSSNTVDYTPVPGSTNAQIFSGKIYAFDRQSGRSCWPSPAIVDHYGLPSDQPTELPMLVFLRNVRARSRNNTQTSVLCVDKRDGRVLLAKDDVPVQSNFYEITADTEKKTVTIQLGVRVFTLHLTNDPTPPEPPAQPRMGAGPAQGPRAKTRGLIASLVDQFNEALAEPAEEKQ